jgi:hypothetical protein
MKMFIHEEYSRRLTAIQLQNIASQQGYVQQIIYNILNEKKDNNTYDNATATTQMVTVATTGSIQGSTYTANTTQQSCQSNNGYQSIVSQSNSHHAANGSNVIQPPTIHCSAGIQCATHPKCDDPQAAIVYWGMMQPRHRIRTWQW